MAKALEAGRSSDAALTAQEQLPVLTLMYDLNRWLLLTVQKFPRGLRATLGDRISETALSVQLNLLDAAYVRDKAALLDRANRGLTKLQTLIRMAKDVRAISIKQYEFASRISVEVGVQIGAWRRSL